MHILLDVKEDDGAGEGGTQMLLSSSDRFVPPEFRNITTLFDIDLLKRWYPKTHENR